MLSTLLDVCIQPQSLVETLVDEELTPGDGAVGVQAFVARACASARKKNDVCGLIQSRACPLALLDGAMAMPFDPSGCVPHPGPPAPAARLARRRTRRARQGDVLDVAADAAFAEASGIHGSNA